MSIHHAQPIAAGKFLLTPMTRSARNGLFTAALSIRRGQGPQTHDRVYGFTPEFDNRECALRYAADQGRSWLLSPMAFA